jgi:hypothetical protein
MKLVTVFSQKEEGEEEKKQIKHGSVESKETNFELRQKDIFLLKMKIVSFSKKKSFLFNFFLFEPVARGQTLIKAIPVSCSHVKALGWILKRTYDEIKIIF